MASWTDDSGQRDHSAIIKYYEKITSVEVRK